MTFHEKNSRTTTRNTTMLLSAALFLATLPIFPAHAQDTSVAPPVILDGETTLPNPPIVTESDYNHAKGTADYGMTIKAYLSYQGILSFLGSDVTTSTDNSWSITFSKQLSAAQNLVFYSASATGQQKSFASASTIQPVNELPLPVPVIGKARPDVFSGAFLNLDTSMALDPSDMAVDVYRNHGSLLASGSINQDGTSWTATPYDTVPVGTQVWARVVEEHSGVPVDDSNMSAIVTVREGDTINYMPYVNFVLDSSESVLSFRTAPDTMSGYDVMSGYDFGKDVINRVLEKFEDVTVLNADGNPSISNHISFFDVNTYNGFSVNGNYEGTNIFEQDIITSTPVDSFYFKDNDTLTNLISKIENIEVFAGTSDNNAGFLWGLQTIYNTPGSSSHPQAYGTESDLRAGMVISVTDGYDYPTTTNDEMNQNDVCQIATTTLSGLGIEFKPYFVGIPGITGAVEPVDTDFLTTCFAGGTQNSIITDVATESAVEGVADTVFNAIMEFGNSIQ